jgi:hypothetical protein
VVYRTLIPIVAFLTTLVGGVASASADPRPAPELFPTGPAAPVVLQRQADDPRLVRLKAVVFDPLHHAAPDFAAMLPAGPALRPTTTNEPLLIQFAGPISGAEHRALDARGFDVLGYVPNHTLVVRARGDGEGLGSVPGRRWDGTFLPAYKLDPELARRLQTSETGLQALAVDVVLFRDDDPWPLVDSVRERFDEASVVHVKRGTSSRITFLAPDSSLARLVGSLIEDPGVQYVALRPSFVPSNDNSVWIGQSYDRINGPTEAQAVDPKPYLMSATVWNRGLTGVGQTIAVADTGLEHEMCFFDDPDHVVIPQTVSPPAPLVVDNEHRKIVALNAPFAGSLATDDMFRHGTHVAGSAVGDSLTNAASGVDAGHDHGDGMAPGAKLVFEDISGTVNGNCGTGIVVASVGHLLEQEYGAGARISTNSWGPGNAAAARDVDTAVWDHEDYLVLWAAGNHGASGPDALATCKNCVTVGATENYDEEFADAFGILDPENMAALSSRGPTQDGRIKPDIVAPGYRVSSARFPVDYIFDESDPACDESDPEVCLPGFGGCYVMDSSATCHATNLLGTSMASPVAAGLSALARQYFVDGFHPTGVAVGGDTHTPSAALVKAVLINGARNMTGRLYERRGTPSDLGPLADAPSQVQGWGRVMLDDGLYFAGDARRSYLFDLPNAQGLVTGESIELSFSVADAAEPLELTLVWTGPPALPSTGALVNDLDLWVEAPGGTIYRGNQWSADDVNVIGDKSSAPNPLGKDSLNNVEGILIPAPAPGLYTVTLFGSSVPGGEGVLSQGAAFIATGSVDACTELAAPVALGIVSADSEQIELMWDAVPGALGYTILRNGSTCSDPMASDQVVELPAEATSYVDTNVFPETLYNYTVRAVLSVAGCETVDSECVSLTTPSIGPPPVPDGVLGSPLVAAKLNETGTSVRVIWDASCSAPGYHLLYGALDDLGGPTPAGAECALDTSGVFDWPVLPAGDLWFLVVGDDETTTEGSWGLRSDGSERAGTAPSNLCSMTLHHNTGFCF